MVLVFHVLTNDLDGLTNKIGIAEHSIRSVVEAFRSGASIAGKGKISGRFTNVFAQFKSITENDIAAIQNYNKAIDDGITSQTAYYKTMSGTSLAAKNLVASFNGAKVSEDLLTTATEQSTIAMIGARVAATALNMALTMGISLAIQAVISGISKLIHAEEELHETVSGIIDEYDQQYNTLMKNKSAFDGLTEKYGELSKGVNDLGQNVSLTEEEYEEYLDVCNQIGSYVPSLIQGFDDQGNAILTCKDNVEELTAAYNDLIQAQNAAVLGEGKKIFKDFQNQAKDYFNQSSYDSRRYSAIPKLKEILQSTNIDAYLDELHLTGQNDIETIAGLLQEKGIEKRFLETYQEFVSRAVKENSAIAQSIVMNFENELTGATSEMQTLVAAWISNVFSDKNNKFSAMDSGMKSLVERIVSAFDFDFYHSFDSVNDLYEYLNTMLSDIQSLAPEDQETLIAYFDARVKFNNGESMCQVNVGKRTCARIAV